MTHYDVFVQAINEKRIIKLQFNSYEKWIIERRCVPFDFWPSRRNISPNPERFHYYDLSSPDWKHNLSILPEQIIKMEVIDEFFEPENYITWTPNWFLKRDWGSYS